MLWENSSSFPKQALVFTCLQYRSIENTVRKEEIALKQAISPFSYSVFYPLWRTFCHLHGIQNCHLQTLNLGEFL